MRLNRIFIKNCFLVVGILLLILNLLIFDGYSFYYGGIRSLLVLGGAIFNSFGTIDGILSILGFSFIWISLLIKGKDITNKKSLWLYIVQIILGIIPFVGILVYGLNSAINGFTFWNTTDYGYDAFESSLFIGSLMIWPYYLIGLIFFIKGIRNILKIKKLNG